MLLFVLALGQITSAASAQGHGTSNRFAAEDAARYEFRLDPASQFERRIEYMDALGFGQSVTAELTPEEMAHIWEFGGGAGDDISISMISLTEELDPFLLLLALEEAQLERLLALSDEELSDLVAVADELGVLLAVNDDRDADTNSLIPLYTLPEDGQYVILATSCCTGESSGLYELNLELAPNQPPGPPGESVANLRNYFPREGPAGSELVLTLEGDGFPDIGLPVAVDIGGIEVPLLDAELVDDQTMQVAIFIPEDLSPGEQEISFFFENEGFDGPFFVFGPGPGAPVDPGPGDPGPIDPGPVDPNPVDPGPSTGVVDGPRILLLPIMVGGGILLLLFLTAVAGVAVIRFLRRGRQPVQPPPAAPSIRFEHDRDAGRQSIEPAARSLKSGVDVRFRLSAGKGRATVEGDDSSLAA